jgi:hypothetical protein
LHIFVVYCLLLKKLNNICVSIESSLMDDLFEHMISSLSEDIGNAGRSCLVSDT